MANLDGGINRDMPPALPIGVKVATGLSGTALGVSTVAMTVFLVIFPHMGALGIAALISSEGVAFIAFAVSLYFLNKKQDARLESIQEASRPIESDIGVVVPAHENPPVVVAPPETMRHLHDSCTDSQNPNELKEDSKVKSEKSDGEGVAPSHSDAPKQPIMESFTSKDFDEFSEFDQAEEPIEPQPEHMSHLKDSLQSSLDLEQTPAALEEPTKRLEKEEKGKEEMEPNELPPGGVAQSREKPVEFPNQKDFDFEEISNSPNTSQIETAAFRQFAERLQKADTALACFLLFFPKEKIKSFTCDKDGKFTMTFEKECIGKIKDQNLGSLTIPQTVEGQINGKKVWKIPLVGEIITRGFIQIHSAVTLNITHPKSPVESVNVKALKIESEEKFFIDTGNLAYNLVTKMPMRLLNQLEIEWS